VYNATVLFYFNSYWENLKIDVQRFIQQCLHCQLKKLVRVKTKQPMIITDTPGSSFDKVAMDIVGPLPKTERGNEYILTLQDQLTKFSMGIPLSDQTAETVAEAFVDRFICVFGSPKAILTDQGRNFISDLMKKVAKIFIFTYMNSKFVNSVQPHSILNQTAH